MIDSDFLIAIIQSFEYHSHSQMVFDATFTLILDLDIGLNYKKRN